MTEASLRLERRVPAPPLWAIGPLILGVFGADLHKLAVNGVSMMLDAPLEWEAFARNADVIIASTLLILSGLHLARIASMPRTVLTPVVIQLLLAVVLTIALFRHFDEFSYYHYKRYIGGNLTLFLGALLLCRGQRQIRFAWRVWVITAALMSLLGIWYWVHGISWSSARAQLVPGTGIRMGYHSALGLVYLLFSRDRLFSSIRLPLVAALVFAVFVSGSKMAVLLTLVLGAGFALRNLALPQRDAAGKFFLMLAMGVCGMLTAVVILRGDQLGFYAQTFDLRSYEQSYQVRTKLGAGYLRLALDKPCGGNGIAAAYDESLGNRTHSIVQAFLVQTGLPGALLYLVFLGWLTLNGLRMLRSRSSLSPGYDLLVATYVAVLVLLVKGETTGDIPGNRELWFFSGLLVGCFLLQLKACGSRIGVYRLIANAFGTTLTSARRQPRQGRFCRPVGSLAARKRREQPVARG